MPWACISGGLAERPFGFCMTAISERAETGAIADLRQKLVGVDFFYACQEYRGVPCGLTTLCRDASSGNIG